jgi:hypothetical protein
MFLGLLFLGIKLSFPSIHNDVVDGIPENYVYYYKKYLYEIEFFRFKKSDSIDSLLERGYVVKLIQRVKVLENPDNIF